MNKTAVVTLLVALVAATSAFYYPMGGYKMMGYGGLGYGMGYGMGLGGMGYGMGYGMGLGYKMPFFGGYGMGKYGLMGSKYFG